MNPSARWGRLPNVALILGVVPALVLAQPRASTAAAAVPTLESRFADPSASHRILKIIHGWPDEPDRQDGLRERIRSQGFGGVVCNVSFDDYLQSPPRWQAFVRAVREARQAGLALWLYDERGYPSGSAGGQVLRDHPDWEAEGLLVADTECGEGPLKLDLPPGEFVAAAARPLDDRARTHVDPARRWLELPRPEGRSLEWKAPDGRWHVAAFTRGRLYEGTHADGNLWQKLPYPNLLRPEPTRRFIELTYDRYAEHLGPDLGRWFEATFTDEPSLMSLFLQRMPWRPLPWSPDLPAEFLRRRGYDLRPALPDLVLSDPHPDAVRHRHDFWRTIGELVSEHYFGRIQTWCRAHGIASGGHLLAEERLLEHVPLYGDFYRCLRRLDAPSMDCLTSLPADVPWHVARLVASVAEIEGRPLVMSETSDHSQVWRPPGDSRPKRLVTEAEIRGTCHRLLIAGVNAITSYYSFEGLDDDALRRLNDRVGRAATLLRGSQSAAPIALVYPAESLWTQFVPARHWAGASPGANFIDTVYRATLETLFEHRRDVSIIDSRVLLEGRIESGELRHDSHRWPVVILPGVDTLPLAAWKKLEQFVDRGGLLVALGGRPANDERQFPSPDVRALGARIFAGPPDLAFVGAVGQGRTAYLPAGTEPLLIDLLNRSMPAVVNAGGADSPIRATHRRLDGHELFFVINDGREPWSGKVGFAARGPGRRWDLDTGRTHPVAADGPATLQLAPYDAAAFTFASAAAPDRKPLDPGPIRAPDLRSIVHATPLESHGEFVRATLASDENRGDADRGAWRASAELTRTQVDTFLFVRFPVEATSGLPPADLVELETWVPEGQRCTAGLLLILHEQDGADYLAEVARPLDSPGYVRNFVPMNRFRLAGWSKDANERLDPDRVREIRVGWGGYYGTERERVEFSLRAPRLARVAERRTPAVR